METVRCAFHTRGTPTLEWQDGKEKYCYCNGLIDKMNDEPLPECKKCLDHVSHAADDFDVRRRLNDG